MPADDELWMRRAIELAEQGRGHVEPNPLVGAVVVRDGQQVGEGWHEKFGAAHAEVNALAQAGAAAKGATLYVTLEPCCHHGKTPPCTDALIRAGIARVVVAMADPFPQVAGQGAAQLRAAGIKVDIGVCANQARRQNAPYLKLVQTGRPYVHAKWAMTLDGKIATKTGDSKWISNESSRRIVHELRGRMDGILVGVGTVFADDPLLTARPPGPRVATRVVVDTKGRIAPTSQLVQTARHVPTIIATTQDVASLSPLTDAGCEVLTLPPDYEGKPNLESVLDELGRRRWTNLLVEGGAAVFGKLFDRRLVDEVHLFIAPKLTGSSYDKTPVAGRGFDTVALGGGWITESIQNTDGDAYIRCLFADNQG
jgi:diaminohydroxyphosphoribosylaminopyrimidine deaminase/5-amino-6-(5-phosphoribosylamino)uracil reductase